MPRRNELELAVPFCRLVLILFLSTSTAYGKVSPYTDREAFTKSSGASVVRETYETAVKGGEIDPTRPGPVIRSLGDSILQSGHYTHRFEGTDLTTSGLSNFVVSYDKPVSAAGFEIEDPRSDSVFALELLRNGRPVGRAAFGPPGTTLPGITAYTDNFVGVTSDRAFDEMRVREIHGRGDGDREYFGRFYSSREKAAHKDNVVAIVCQAAAGATYNFLFPIALIPNPFSLPADLAAYSANLILKGCPSVVVPPPDRIITPTDPNVCTYRFDAPRMAYKYTNLLGIPLGYDFNWGDFGSPTVVHHNTSADIQMLTRGMPDLPHARNLNLDIMLGTTDASDEVWDGCEDNGNGPAFSRMGYACPYQTGRYIDMPVGANGVTWRSEARASIIDLIWVYIPGVPSGWKNGKTINKVITAINFVLDIAETAAGVAVEGWRFGNTHDEEQAVIIHDIVPPRVESIIPPDYRPGFEEFQRIEAVRVGNRIEVKIQADEIGGVSRSRYESRLRRDRVGLGIMEARDFCDDQPGTTRVGTLQASYPDPDLAAFWPVITEAQDTSFDITWTALDPGPNVAGERNVSTEVRMKISVVDEQPPAILAPPDIVEVTEGQVSDLGQPLVFDFVDLNPTVTNDANLPLGTGVHFVTWTARDASGNEATAVQLVNIKTSNQDPSAIAQTGGNSASAVSFEPTELTLRGDDPDDDPLYFYIEDYPQNGFFVAPLYPYFVEDYRLEATMSDEAIQAECDRRFAEHESSRFELEEPRDPNYMSVTDSGRTYVQDRGSILCQNDRGLDFQGNRRIAVFGESGALVNAFPFQNQVDEFLIDYRTDLVYTTRRGSQSNGAGGRVTEYDLDMNRIRTWELRGVANGPFTDVPGARSGIIDRNGVLYVLTRFGDLYAFDGNGEPDQSGDVTPVYLDTLLETTVSSEDVSLAMDSEDNLYVSLRNRIHKVSGSTINAEGNIQLGNFVGWLGRCDADFAPGDQAVCDVANQRSLGFACTDDYCGASGGQSGSEPGQFNNARGIAVDPNDILYVTDYDNFRVQRFTADGFFAGQAVSSCDGSCFVLGDFGRPTDISVNSDHFYILDQFTNLIHVSQTSPFLEIGDDYAIVEYQSDNDFACELSADCIDEFSFSTSDGVRDPDTMQPLRSAPATVEVEVSRNFRPPFATSGVAELIMEDTPTAITLDGSDPDPLDMLTFRITSQPSHGTVSVSGNQATYAPDADYYGEDEFSFTVSDGMDTSSSEPVQISVENVNDVPSLTGPDRLEVGRGFRIQVPAEFTDPDPEDAHLVQFDWGDGNVENEGDVEADGTITGPVLTEATDGSTGTISATHVYDASGTYQATVTVWDNVIVDDDGNKSIDPMLSESSTLPIMITVRDMVDVAIASTESAEPVTPGQSLTYEFEVINVEPEGSAGVTATGVSLDIKLDPALQLVTSIPACASAGQTLSCNIGTLGVGAGQTVSVVTNVSASATAGELLQTEAEVFVNEPDQSDLNEIVEFTPVSRPADFFVGASGDALYDEPDVNPGDGICASASDVCTLRAAIEESNAEPGLNTIALGNGNYVLGLEDTAKGGSSELTVSDNLIILGNGPDVSILDGNDTGRILRATAGVVLQLDGLTLARGETSTRGGALLGESGNQITLTDVHVTDNEASSGGGIDVSGTLVLERVTFSGNVATNGGGALWQSGDSQLSNVTVAGNRANGFGGGIVFAEGDHTVTNATIFGNSTDGDGGGVALAPTVSSVAMVNTIVANNDAADTDAECHSIGATDIASQGNNLIGNPGECGISLQPSDRSGDARLRPLSDNGGGTPTLVPQASSQAIDGGSNGACPSTDQRGLSRPRDGNDDGSSICDIGAVEADFLTKFDRIYANGFE